MSVAGVDIGNQSILIGQAGKGGVDVILNESSNRQTATFVSVQGKQRFIGDAASAMARSNVYNTISLMKAFVGRRFDDPEVQIELNRLPYKSSRLSNGGVGIVLNYNNEDLVVPAEHLFAMILIKAKEISAYANNGLNMADAVLAVPHWYTDSQRRAILTSSEIAGLNCLKVANESALIALSYGIFKSAKKLFSETDPVHIIFIDIGYTGYCVTVVDFIQENMKVLSTVCDRQLGGRDFDNVIIEYLAETFQKKTGINVRKNIKALLKLEVAAEKAKKTLSPSGVSEANISVECLAEDRDLSCVLTRDEFEARVQHLVARLENPVVQALAEAGLRKEEITETEVVGGSSRINIIKRKLGEILGLDASHMNYGLKTTMNSDEAVARGGALQCAMLSSRMKVKPFNITDKIAYGITVSFENTSTGENSTVSLYARGDELPHKPRRLTFPKKNADFSIKACYDETAVRSYLPPGEDPTIAFYTVKVPPTGNPAMDVRVTFNIDKHGCLYISSAELLEEIIITSENEKSNDNENEKNPENETTSTEGKSSESKKKFKKIDLDVITSTFGLSKEAIKASIELEASMAFEDRLIVETADKRNELESYIYAMRTKVDGVLDRYATKSEKSLLHGLLQSAEDWLYGEGFDSSKQEYSRKITELRAVGDKVEFRYAEEGNRPAAVDGLKKQVEMCKAFASNRDAEHAHISDEERDKVRAEAQVVEGWIYDLLNKQADLPLHADPVLTVDIINKRRNALLAIANPIMTKPKPRPAPIPTPTPAPAAEEKKTEESTPMDESPPENESK